MRTTVVVLLTILGGACRSVWSHEDPSRWQKDYTECHAQAVEAEKTDPNAPDWQDCMLDRGWHSGAGVRWADPVQQYDP